VPVYFNPRTALRQVNIDLCYLLKCLGISGGLKGCETQLGIDLGELEGLDGYFAVLLRQEYRDRKNEKALETLLAYNAEDTVNLERRPRRRPSGERIPGGPEVWSRRAPAPAPERNAGAWGPRIRCGA
jgi:hypothetical protein